MQSKKIHIIIFGFILIATIGIADSLYLTKKHYSQEYTCSILEINNCESVLSSSYATIYDIPIALLGAIYYLVIFTSAFLYLNNKNHLFKKILSFLPSLAFAFSIYLVYLQLFVLKSICQYCMISALTSSIIFILSIIFYKNEKKSNFEEPEQKIETEN